MRLLLSLCWLLLSAVPAAAWNDTGHKVIAAKGYQELSPQTRQRVAEILKSHPQYERWNRAFAPGTPRLDLEAFVFLQASIWPDEIPSSGQKEDEHPRWYRIDYPLKPPKFALEQPPGPAENILSGIAECQKQLSAREAPTRVRATALSWLIYLVPELHQPLNCGVLINDAFPNGDHGGNGFYVRRPGRTTTLHRYWDGLLGRATHAPEEMDYAFQLGRQHPRDLLPELTQGSTPAAWSLQSRSVAIAQVYLKTELQGSSAPASAPALPPDYQSAAKKAAERQAALAAYRLADVLTESLR